MTCEELNCGSSSEDEVGAYASSLTSNQLSRKTYVGQNRAFGINNILLSWKITTFFDNGVECREALDDIIHRCFALQKIHQAVFMYRKVLNQ